VAVDLDTKTTKELETIVANGRRLGKTGEPICLDAAKLLNARRNGDYDMEKTVAAIRDHGQQGRFLSYRDSASASGLKWANVFRQISLHLDAVCAYSHGKGWPLLTAIVVNQEYLGSGEMTMTNRKGFLDASRGAGREVDIEDVAFVKREQQRVFEWCQSERWI
jgi:hypothetical protein